MVGYSQTLPVSNMKIRNAGRNGTMSWTFFGEGFNLLFLEHWFVFDLSLFISRTFGSYSFLDPFVEHSFCVWLAGSISCNALVVQPFGSIY